MSDEASFLRAILADPHDDSTRLVYADLLEERDDPRAEYLRLECRFAAAPPGDHLNGLLAARLHRVRAACNPQWLLATARTLDLILRGYPPDRKILVIGLLYDTIGCGLRQAKELAESLPCLVKTCLERGEAQRVKHGFENGLWRDSGPFPGCAVVELQPTPARL